MRGIIKKIILSILLLVVITVGLNYEYFWKQLNYYFAGTSLKDESAPLSADMLVISSLGIKAPIVYIDQADEKHFQQGLKSGVVHYPGTASPGQVGNVFIFGHSSDYFWSSGGYKAVFALLPKIKIGEEIWVTDNQANTFVYKTIKSVMANPDDTSFLDQNTSGKKLLTIQTSYPLGTALRRWIVVAQSYQSDTIRRSN